MTAFRPHSSHWGVFEGGWQDGRLVVRPHAGDPDPNRILQNFPDALRHEARIARPTVRRGWLERGPGPDAQRGCDEFVAVSWDRALGLLAEVLARTPAERIFGGSYGWSSAGRFHHAQSQVHRFLNTALGGYVRSVNSYSAGASGIILPHVVGPMESLSRRNVTWEAVAAQSEVVLAFGGLALKNSMVAGGGISQHIERDSMRAAAERGCEFLLVGPLRDDCPAEARAEWLPITPNTDTALMLALMHAIVAAGRHDRGFLERCTTGWPEFEAYLMGRSDGQPKDAAWAAPITGLSAERIAALAARLPGRRVLVAVAHSLQRAEHGEQPVWAGLALACVLGQVGLPGGGYHYALGALGHTGRRNNLVSTAALPQGRNRVGAHIPVARISDMLLHPGEAYDYNGQRLTYPEIDLVYWAGGNPFHHHQDLNRLREAFRRIGTLVVHEQAWTATARHADIVLPVTMTLEREDIGSSQTDPLMVAMHRLAEPFGEARDDYAIFADLAARLGKEAEFTEGRSAREWLQNLYDRTAEDMREKGFEAPDFEAFWRAGYLELPQAPDDGGMLRAFRDDPAGAPLPTPSGRIELFSGTIAGFGYDDCPGHPAWLAPRDVPDAASPLRLVANQPATRLHSQLDFGGHSQETKRRGREVMRMHPADAATRGIADGDIVRLFNARGACLAAAELTDAVMPGVVNLPTGAWYDPEDPAEDKPLCVHGNPNVLTRDVGTSRLAQGCTGQLATVQVERFTGNLPPVKAFTPPG
ncbi:molybdopterin guanine dinucleotide-containing S/N-oxide reductase [Paracraurococcus lichenis]|uniref:Molybdopterin guanine dinucleotide-containing S/N-oxide reductase n=1 Tax=Paracraurococcus lichenis TaxID=3064888 RepID=A0ABT9DUM8_9PROT|nr:molybdopterin guanine dinucleotide-containing S/N-oxide reductase [Paracraurococcus sp. LOR1-02]MDO9707605.1 molybdopterin guanine dinucleotide-containing S/N-oxide reductase [Paracraurococcus sp. LOR1-02]